MTEVLVDGQYVKMAGRMAVWDCLYVLCIVTAFLTTVLALVALLMPLWFTLYLPRQDRVGTRTVCCNGSQRMTARSYVCFA